MKYVYILHGISLYYKENDSNIVWNSFMWWNRLHGIGWIYGLGLQIAWDRLTTWQVYIWYGIDLQIAWNMFIHDIELFYRLYGIGYMIGIKFTDCME